MPRRKTPPDNVVSLRLPPNARVLALLSMRPAQAEKAARRLGVRLVRREVCRILREYAALADRDVGRVVALLERLGPGSELDALEAIAKDPSAGKPARTVAVSVLAKFAPDRIEEFEVVSTLISGTEQLVFLSMLKEDAGAHVVGLMRAASALDLAVAAEELERVRRFHGAPAWPLYAPLLEGDEFAAIHAQLVGWLAREAGPKTLEVLERVAAGTSPAAPDARRVLLRERNVRRDRERDDDEDEWDDADDGLEPYDVGTYAVYPDAAGDIVVSAEISDDERTTSAWLRLRLGEGVRDGDLEYALTDEEQEESSLWSDRPFSMGLRVRNAVAARLVLDAFARTKKPDRLRRGARAAVAIFRREADRWHGRAPEKFAWRDGPDPEEEIESSEAATLESWRRLLEHRFHEYWELDAGDLAAAGIEPPPNASELKPRRPTEREVASAVPAFDRDRFDRQERTRIASLVPAEWLRDAAARAAKTPVRERLVRMLEHTAAQLDEEDRPKRAALYRREAQRVRDDFESSVLVRAVLERSAIDEENDDCLELAPLSLDELPLRDAVVRALRGKLATKADVAAVDFGEAALFTLENEGRRLLFVEDRPPRHLLADLALALGRRAFDEGAALGEDAVRDVVSGSGLFGPAATALLAPLVREALVRFGERVCGACKVACAAQRDEPAHVALEELVHHPAPAAALGAWGERK